MQEAAVTALLQCEASFSGVAIPDAIKLPLRAGLFRLLEVLMSSASDASRPDIADAVKRLGWTDKVKALLSVNAPTPVTPIKTAVIAEDVAMEGVTVPQLQLPVDGVALGVYSCMLCDSLLYYTIPDR